MVFLDDIHITPRPLNLNVKGLNPLSLYLGKGQLCLEIAVLSSQSKPTITQLHKAFKERKGSRASPVLIIVLNGEEIALCGPSGDLPPVFFIEDQGQVERLCLTALQKPDRNSAIKFLTDALPSFETDLPGISNEGLLSLHELLYGTRLRPDWITAVEKANAVLGKSDQEIIPALGFNQTKIDNLTSLLTINAERTALSFSIEEGESPEASNSKFNSTSPISYALAKADKERLPWVLMVQGDKIRLYNTQNIGVGRRGRTETYIECQPNLISKRDLGLIWLLFSSDALKQNGSIFSILEQSKRFAANIADKLRERIYETVVPQLAMGIADERQISIPSKQDLQLTYEMALTVLFRLLFIAYAEDRDLLPYKSNAAYRKRSLKQKAIELAKAASENTPFSRGDHHWRETELLWKAIYIGNREWGVMPYGGTIFSNNPAISKIGAALDEINLPNTRFESALRSLLLTDGDNGQIVPVDFRSLSVREFGTIYEGLLESELSLAEQNLAINRHGNYLPANKDDKIEVFKGNIYLHDHSGARKSSGSFYTPDFAVEHLLDEALQPALDDHLAKLAGLDNADRTEQFFDFRVADIAMGSGHFLVAAIDRIEQSFSMFLEKNPTPGVLRELHFLRQIAEDKLKEYKLEETVSIENGQLLRRMIAKRCIYGVDLNSITVQLANLSIWIHTFVPGLPLSLLDHNLVHGNALVGVGSLDEVRKKFQESAAGTLFEVDADNLLGQAAEPLEKLAKLSEASEKEIEAGRALLEETRLRTLETKALCDILIAQPLADDKVLKSFQFEDWEQLKATVQSSKALSSARDILKPFNALHFPIAFPEVFLGRSQGFNVILGNPPWEEAVVNEDKFWARHNPGLSSFSPREQQLSITKLRDQRPDLVKELNDEIENASAMRKFLHAGNFPGMGTGDPDLYKAFAWRFWFVSAPNLGRIGIVMPRTALASKGSEEFRRELFSKAVSMDIVTLQNKGTWVFDIHPQYTIGLLSISKNTSGEKGISLKGPFTSLDAFNSGKLDKSIRFTNQQVLEWNESVSLPLLPSNYSAEIFGQLRKFPSLSLDKPETWRARPDGELHATAQKTLMDFSSDFPDGFWKVYKGASFDLWNPDTGEYNCCADPEKVLPWLQKKRLASRKSSKNSIHKEFSKSYIEDLKTLAPLRPRIAFRDISRATDSRTVRCALLPPKTFVTNKAPTLMFPRGDEKDEAFLLGVLSSIPLDWYARRFVETNLNFFILNSFPIPRPKRDNTLWLRIVELAGRLACTDDRFHEWAAKINVECGPLNQSEKEDKIYELDACVAHLFELSEPQLSHIYETFHIGWDYKPHMEKVLKYYRLIEEADERN
jgi:hypothetical protein